MNAWCDCSGAAPWVAMVRLHAGGPHRYYLCRACGAVRDDVYREGSIVEHQWHDEPDGTLPAAVGEEALAVLRAPRGEQIPLFEVDV